MARSRPEGSDVTAVEDPEQLVEYDSTGRSTGVEREDEGSGIEEPFDPAKIDVVTRNPTVNLLMSRLRRGGLNLTPDFQRRAGIWTEIAQSRLIESLLLRIPLPTLYAAESGEDDWVIVDGIQRLTTITRFVAPELVKETYGSNEPLRLYGLEYLKAYEGTSFADLPGNLQTRIEETELLVHLIRAGTPEPVKFNIFARINTGGLPLTAQEMRHALIPGPAREMLAELADSEEFSAATGWSIRSDRMQDREMVLRFLAFRIGSLDTDYKGDLDAFLRDMMQRVNQLDPAGRQKLSGEFRKAMTAALKIFGPHAFRKRNLEAPQNRLPVSRALFEAVSVNLARLDADEIVVLAERSSLIEDRFMALMEDAAFFNAISVGTGDIVKVRRRFETIRDLFEETLR
jgi:hypothetical protein